MPLWTEELCFPVPNREGFFFSLSLNSDSNAYSSAVLSGALKKKKSGAERRKRHRYLSHMRTRRRMAALFFFKLHIMLIKYITSIPMFSFTYKKVHIGQTDYTITLFSFPLFFFKRPAPQKKKCVDARKANVMIQKIEVQDGRVVKSL